MPKGMYEVAKVKCQLPLFWHVLATGTGLTSRLQQLHIGRGKLICQRLGEASLQGQSTPTERSFRPVRACGARSVMHVE